MYKWSKNSSISIFWSRDWFNINLRKPLKVNNGIQFPYDYSFSSWRIFIRFSENHHTIKNDCPEIHGPLGAHWFANEKSLCLFWPELESGLWFGPAAQRSAVALRRSKHELNLYCGWYSNKTTTQSLIFIIKILC